MSYDGFTKYDDKVAASYDLDRVGEAHWQAEHSVVEEFVARHRLGRVLDLPVGTGRFLPLYREADLVVGADISESMLRVSKERIGQLGMTGVELLRGDAMRLPFPDNMFDSVLCFRLVHLLPPQIVPALFNELARVARGRILLQLYLTRPRPAWRGLPLIRALGRLKARLRRRTLPWSHIESFGHTEPFLFECLRTSGLRLETVHRLGDYAGLEVVVYELSK